MKVVLVENPYDSHISPQKRVALEALKPLYPNVEFHVVDFNRLRASLPITTAPCVFFQFDEAAGDYDPANVEAIIRAVQALDLPKPQ